METDSRDLDIVEDLCRLDREREQSTNSNLDLCELVVQSRSASEPRREWVPASDCSRSLPKLS